MSSAPRRGKQSRGDEGDKDSRVNAAANALRKATISERDAAVAAQKPKPDEEDAAGSEGSWESVDDDNDVDERFDEMAEEIVQEDDDDDDDEADDGDEEYKRLADEKRKVKFTNADANEDDEDAEGNANDERGTGGQVGKVWRRDRGEKLESNEKLEFVNRAYDCFFQMRSEFPCLSFDIIRDHEGAGRTKYPLAMSLVVGSQAAESNANQLYIIRVRNLLRTKYDEGEDDESDEDMFGANDSEGDEDEDEEEEEKEEINSGEPLISFQTIRHHGAVNRVRSNPLLPSMLATWSDAGIVQVFDTAAEVSIVAEFSNAVKEQNVSAEALARKTQPLKFASSPSNSHKTEGYGLDWSRVSANTFASGDLDGKIYIWKPAQAGRWAPLAGTPGSAGRFVEEIQWSPTQEHVLIAARAKGDVEVWDSRDMKKSKICYKADASDINVAAWNTVKAGSHLIATGAESGTVAVWDLRKVATPNQRPEPIQCLTFHNGAAISAVEFSEHNESVLAVTSDDGQATIWDLSVERDPDEEREVLGKLFNRNDTTTLPDQLMFQHQGLTHPKEVHFHPQVPGMVVTGDFNGLNIFKPRNWRSLMK
jgi:ribosome assembly protein RRB1